MSWRFAGVKGESPHLVGDQPAPQVSLCCRGTTKRKMLSSPQHKCSLNVRTFLKLTAVSSHTPFLPCHWLSYQRINSLIFFFLVRKNHLFRFHLGFWVTVLPFINIGGRVGELGCYSEGCSSIIFGIITCLFLGMILFKTVKLCMYLGAYCKYGYNCLFFRWKWK